MPAYRHLMIPCAFVMLSFVPLPASGQGLSPTEIASILATHNEARCAVTPAAASMPAMQWDGLLAQVAQNHANAGVFTHNPLRTQAYLELGGSGSVGENLAISPSGPGGANLWVDEGTGYVLGPLDTSDVISFGHYTQVIWAASTKIGCGVANISAPISGRFLVCNYAPAGNFGGQPPYIAGMGVNEACGGATPPPSNLPPLSDAGPDQTVVPGGTVTLDGSLSSDPEGVALTFTWTQVGGPSVAVASPNSSTPSFVAPVVAPTAPTLTFQLVVSDGEFSSTIDSMTVRVLNGTLPAGPAGPQGEIGATGPAGAAGANGADGAQGLQGPAGVAGPQGLQGPEGPGVPIGSVIFLDPSVAPPPGFTYVGESTFNIRTPSGGMDRVTLKAYRRN
jgi:hypothetical protein